MTKPEYHQSSIRHHGICPKKYDLSTKHEPDIPVGTQNAMRSGELFEGYVLGFKDDKDESELIGRRKPETIDKIRNNAKHIKPIFKNGKSFKKIKAEFPEYDLAGEIDHFGQLDWDFIREYTGEEVKPEGTTINDLKYTDNIAHTNSAWSKDFFLGMPSPSGLLQAIQYVAIMYFNDKKIYPFVYIVVEGQYDRPVLYIKKVLVSKDDIEGWFMPFVNRVHNDMYFRATPSYDACLGGKRGSRCWFLEHCKEGRAFVGGYEAVEFAQLII